jgi:hypothetical protein
VLLAEASNQGTSNQTFTDVLAALQEVAKKSGFKSTANSAVSTIAAVILSSTTKPVQKAMDGKYYLV